MPAPLTENRALSRQRFLFVTGKGGVGKSTVTAALARSFARQGKRVLVAGCSRKERLSALLGAAPLSADVREAIPGIWTVLLDSKVAIREYGQLILGGRRVYQTVFDNRYVESFFNAVPGLNEWAVLGKAWYHSIEQDDAGQARFDVVLFDAPATGHGLEMLRVPKVILDIVPPGILRRDAERAWEMFQDPQQSGVVVVSLAEDMPTNETVELVSSVRDELHLPIPQLIVNAVLDQLFNEQERDVLLGLDELPKSPPGMEGIAAGVRRAIRERVQDESLRRLLQIGVPTTRLPLLFGDAAQPDAVQKLSERLAPLV